MRESTLTMVSHLPGAEVTDVREFDRRVPKLPRFSAELNVVWTNLIGNAVGAAGAGAGTLRGRQYLGTVRVEVCDTAPGISDDLLTLIFDPFFTKPVSEGTGPGLDIAARIVDEHSASLWADSSPGDMRFMASPPIAKTPAGVTS